MGTTKAALALAIAVLSCASAASADPCTAKTPAGSPFAVCFDMGNRLFLEGGTDGVGGGLRLRQTVGFDDEPDLIWKLDHRGLEGSVGGLSHAFSGVLYQGRYVRHARDGHIVLPLGTPRKFFVPFDIGAEAEVGGLVQDHAGGPIELRAVEVAGLIDLSRSESFRRRLAIGLIAHWDVRVDREPWTISENLVAPLSMLKASAYAESQDGLSAAELVVSGGREWSSLTGWQWQASATLSVERVLLAINDRPLSLLFEGRAKAPNTHSKAELTALAGARFSLFSAKRAAF